MVAAALLTESLPLPSALQFPPPVLLIALIGLVALPFLASKWRVTFWVLLAWFMVEDLIRKYLGNDIRVYFMKDGLYLMLVVGLLIDPAVRGVWKRATGSAAAWLYAMIAWSVVLSIPMAFVDWRIPLIALKLDWQYVPLVIAGYLLASEEGGVRRLLTGFVILGIPACLVGIIQAQFGPDFLRPTVVTEASQLLRLDLTRTHDVFQPTGTFVDAGRFGAMAMLTYVSALALLLLTHRTSTARGRAFAVIGVIVAAGAIWAHAGKTGIIVAAAIAVDRGARAGVLGSPARGPPRDPGCGAGPRGGLAHVRAVPPAECQPGRIPIGAARPEGEHERMAVADQQLAGCDDRRGEDRWRNGRRHGGRFPRASVSGGGQLRAGNRSRTSGGRLRFRRAAMGGHRPAAVVGLDDGLDGTPLAVLKGRARDAVRGRGFADHFLGGHLPIREFRRWLPVLSELLRERLPLGLLRDRFRVPGHRRIPIRRFAAPVGGGATTAQRVTHRCSRQGGPLRSGR